MCRVSCTASPMYEHYTFMSMPFTQPIYIQATTRLVRFPNPLLGMRWLLKKSGREPVYYKIYTTNKSTVVLARHTLTQRTGNQSFQSENGDMAPKIKLGPNCWRSKGIKTIEWEPIELVWKWLNKKMTRKQRSTNQHFQGQTIKPTRNEQFGALWTHSN